MKTKKLTLIDPETLWVNYNIAADNALVQPLTKPTFVIGGKIITPVGAGISISNSVIEQADGKILLGGPFVHSSGTFVTFSKYNLVRYNKDGSLDTTFDSDGKLTTNLLGGYSMALQANDKILLGGYSARPGTMGVDFTLVRYNTDGSLDTSFDKDGKVTTRLSTYDSRDDLAQSVVVQADGKILLGGSSDQDNPRYGNDDFAIVRYNNDGSLDKSFGGDGKVTTQLGTLDDVGRTLAVQADGKILLGGSSGGYVKDDFALVRYNKNGSLDTSFSGDGKVITDLGSGYEQAYSIALQADGKILLSGVTGMQRGYRDIALVRYNKNGSLDTSFDGDGIVITDLGEATEAGFSVVVQADGKILVAGSSGADFALVRYNKNGSLDTSFDHDGKVITDFGKTEGGYSVTLQADGKILVAGGSNGSFALVRYNSNGSVDNTFNPINTLNGKATYVESKAAAVLDSSVQIYDAELAYQGHYNGASITLVRHAGANSQDVFSGSGQLVFSGGNAVLSGVNIGTLTNSDGKLTIHFNSNATQTRVDTVLSSLAYSNTSDTPPSSVQIDWIFSDGSLNTKGFSIVNIIPVNDILGTARNDTLIGTIGFDKIYGLGGNDNLKGLDGEDTIDGGEGNDILDGGLGKDILIGGKGNDIYFVDDAKDIVSEKSAVSTEIDTVKSTASYILGKNIENLTLTGTSAIDGRGNELNNTLIGNAANNQLNGFGGKDIIVGGLGQDTLISGGGYNIFKYFSIAESGVSATKRDIIDGFIRYVDKIDLSAIDADTTHTGNDAFTKLTLGRFAGVFTEPGELFLATDGNLETNGSVLYGNNDADSAADFSIEFPYDRGAFFLTLNDFIL